MKLLLLTPDNKNAGSVTLPVQFEEVVRPEVIRRAAEAMWSRNRQAYGASPEAGKRQSVWISKRRRRYRGCYGHGISRVPRKIMSRNGMRMNWVGAFAPGTVGGRRAHPPKAEKIWERKINKKENRLAIRSALAATMHKGLVAARGHQTPQQYPFIISNDFEKIAKTKQLVQSLRALGLKEELERCAQKKIRAGKGKARGRPYKKRTGPLMVVATNAPLLKLQLPGVDIVMVNALNAHLLAPGAPGRLTLYTESAIERLRTEQLFMNNYSIRKQEKKEEEKHEKKEQPTKQEKPAPEKKTRAAKQQDGSAA